MVLSMVMRCLPTKTELATIKSFRNRGSLPVLNKKFTPAISMTAGPNAFMVSEFHWRGSNNFIRSPWTMSSGECMGFADAVRRTDNKEMIAVLEDFLKADNKPWEKTYLSFSDAIKPTPDFLVLWTQPGSEELGPSPFGALGPFHSPGDPYRGFTGITPSLGPHGMLPPRPLADIPDPFASQIQILVLGPGKPEVKLPPGFFSATEILKDPTAARIRDDLGVSKYFGTEAAEQNKQPADPGAALPDKFTP